VLGASFDDVGANRAFAEKFSFPYKLLCDTERTLGTAYGALDPGEPDYARRISYVIGPDGRIMKAYGKVQPATHPDQVLADLPR
jgi:peroxiredoxin Q/BCP